LAGNRQESMTIAAAAVHGARLGICNPAAIAISAKPVRDT
jgi:hypothetical protein